MFGCIPSFAPLTRLDSRGWWFVPAQCGPTSSRWLLVWGWVSLLPHEAFSDSLSLSVPASGADLISFLVHEFLKGRAWSLFFF